MTYDIERLKLTRKPVLIFEADLDLCANTYGQTIAALSNSVTDPEVLDAGAWSTFGTMTKTANTNVAPDGNQTADTLEDTDGTNNSGIYETVVGYGSGSNYWVASVFVKKDTIGRATRFVDLRLYFTSSSNENNRLYVDTLTGEYSSLFESTAGIYGVEDYDNNWWRIYISAKRIAANNNIRIQIYPSDGSGASWTRDGTVTGSADFFGAALYSNFGAPTELESYFTFTCTATGAAGEECFNTRATCQDLVNYKVFTSKIYRFSDTFIEGENIIPCIKNSELAPTVLSPSKGLGQRASIKVTFKDFSHHDRGYDPYVSNRIYDPASQGTFFGKFVARNKHYTGRPARIKTGYISESGFDINDFQTRNYVLDGIEGPNPRGDITIRSKDILKLADDKRALCPPPSTGLLTADISDSATTLVVTSGTESEYDDTEYLIIGDEIIFSPIANRTANSFANLTRSSHNTDAATHDTGDTVQNCKEIDSVNVVDLVEDFFVNYANIPAGYIPSTDWTTEKNKWFSTSDITTLITSPTGITTLVERISEQFQLQIWWDEIVQEIKLKAMVPPSAVTPPDTLNEESHLIKEKTIVEREDEKRLSRIIIYYNPHNPIDISKPEHFKSVYVLIGSDAEGPTAHGDIRHKIIYAEFIPVLSNAIEAGGRLLNRFSSAINSLKLSLDAKDASVWTGDLVNIDNSKIQNADGSNKTLLTQVLSVKENTSESSGSRFDYKLLELNFSGRYAFIGPDTLLDYDAESDANRAAYGFIAPDVGPFGDGEPAYRII